MKPWEMNRSDLRRDEILEACQNLYEDHSFGEITLKEIGERTSCSRSSIYNYFDSREEIFLELFRREYGKWNEDLERILHMPKMSQEQFADELADSLEPRKTMLKLLAVNLYDIEENCSIEQLTRFKFEYARSLNLLKDCLETHCPNVDAQAFMMGFMPFTCGLYPYTFLSGKQAEAMKTAGIVHDGLDVRTRARTVIAMLLKGAAKIEPRKNSPRS